MNRRGATALATFLFTLLSLALAGGALALARAEPADAIQLPTTRCSVAVTNVPCDMSPPRCEAASRCDAVGDGILGRVRWYDVILDTVGRVRVTAGTAGKVGTAGTAGNAGLAMATQPPTPTTFAGTAGNAGPGGVIGPTTTVAPPHRCDVDGLVVTCYGPAGTKSMTYPAEGAVDAACRDLPCHRPFRFPWPSAPALVSAAVVALGGLIAAIAIRRANRPT